MNHKGILLRLIFIALACAAAGYFIGYENGARDAKDFVMEHIDR
jgi:hypothetical protein